MSLVENPPEIQRLLERDLKLKVTPLLGEENVRVRVVASWGRPDAPLIQIVREAQADLVVIGTHQRQGLSRFWLGSVSRSVLYHAPTSVAVVPAAEPSPSATGQIPEINRVLVKLAADEQRPQTPLVSPRLGAALVEPSTNARSMQTMVDSSRGDEDKRMALLGF